jgi:type II secretory pathway component PulF
VDETPRPNPYRPAEPRTADLRRSSTGKRPVGLLIAAVIEAWMAGYTAFTAPSTLEEFRAMFVSFGADLPGSTKALLATPWLWMPFAFVAIGILIWIGVKARPTDAEKDRMHLALWIFGIAFGASVAWAAFALYVPIFELGSAV